MRFKLDENLAFGLVSLLAQFGHDGDTVRDEGLGGATDTSIYVACLSEQRILLTMDLDFSDARRFPPDKLPGVVVLRPKRALISLIADLLKSALEAMQHHDVAGCIWIVEPGRIRVHEPLP